MRHSECDFRVYWNATKKVYSVQHKSNGRWKLYGHYTALRIANGLTKVSDTIRERVRREQKKYVHAWIYCQYFDVVDPRLIDRYHSATQVRYNPYKNLTFMMDDGNGGYTEVSNMCHSYTLSVESPSNSGKFPKITVVN